MADSTITALVGTRAYPVSAAEQATQPYIVWQRVSTVPVEDHGEGTTLEEISIQVTCFAASHAAAIAIRRAVRAVIDRNHSDGPAIYENAQDLGVSDDRRSYAVSADFTIWHDDTTA